MGMGGAVFRPVRPGPLTLRRKSSSACEALQTLFGFMVFLSYIGNFRFDRVGRNRVGRVCDVANSISFVLSLLE